MEGDLGFLGSFLSKGLKTNQLEVNTDEKTLRPIARLKEPRDLFALPKDKDNDCSQQAPRWPIECQVIEERIKHIPNVPQQPEPFYQPTGNELKPNPVGEENGIVVFNYNPISAVNYDKTKKSRSKIHIPDDSSDSDVSSCESQVSSPELQSGLLSNDKKLQQTITKLLNTLEQRSSSNSNEEDDDDDEDDEDEDENEEDTEEEADKTLEGEEGADRVDRTKTHRKHKSKKNAIEEPGITEEEIDSIWANRTPTETSQRYKKIEHKESLIESDHEFDNIWADKSPEYMAATPTYIKNQIDKNVKAQQMKIIPPFSRSAVGGSKFLTNCHPYNPEEYDGLEFESRFESGNLAKAIQITPTYYELYLRPDLYTSRSKQWFYFRVKRTKKNMIYRFSIVNLIKSDSLYNEGMRPVMYSTIEAKTNNVGWKRCGDNICYYRNDEDSQPSEDDEDNSSYTLTFNIEFEHDNDTVFFAHSYPYTYSDLQDYLMEIQKNPIKSKFCKLRLLCRTLAGNNVYYLTVTTPTTNEEIMKRKKSVVISARVHPSETPSSWMMKGLMDFITGESCVAKRLRHRFIFKLIPMLNPDGVIVGNTRNSLTGKDLNRQYRTVIRETYPSIWYTKALIKRLIDDCGVSMYCDMHAHSRRHNIFIYGCENKRNPEKKLTEQVFPLMLHKNVADKFSFENCKFKIQRSKEGTGRIVVWMLGITNSYTIEASFGGSLLGSRKGTHFTTTDYEHMGRGFCETLLDYCDENPNKYHQILQFLSQQECLRLKIIERLLKEGSSAEEPINIPLSDYSSDEGSSSSSDNEGKEGSNKDFSDLEGPCCQPLRAPPCSPELDVEIRKFRYRRMRKIMQELDRIYFQPLFHKKCKFLLKASRRNPFKKQKRKLNKKVKDLEANSQVSKEVSETNSQDSQSPKEEINLRYVRDIKRSCSSTSIKTLRPQQEFRNRNSNFYFKKRKKGGEDLDQKPHVKVSRKLRLWLTKRQIFILRRKLPHRLKFRLKSLYRRKKDERLLLDMPTTDPGSDLLFSTDDEYVDANGIITCYGTMPPRIRRNLLKSELQRRYIEEIGDGFRNMPPELIITSPSNKGKQSKHSVRFLYKPVDRMTDKKSPIKNELPFLGQPAKRTSSWHNLNTAGQSPTLTPYKTNTNINKVQGPFYRPLSKKEALTKEDLEIKLSLKKKIWTGIQTDDDLSLGIDRTRPLSWVAPQSLKSKKMSEQTFHNGPNLAKLSSGNNNAKRLENEAFLTACSQKLMEWQIMNTNPEDSSPRSQKTKMPLRLVVPDINEDRTMSIFKHLVNIENSSIPITSTKVENECSTKTKTKRTTISKVVETSKILTKISKTKSRNNLTTIHRSGAKQSTVPHKSHGRSNKFKTGGLVVTAVQTGVSGTAAAAGAKKNNKLKSLQNKQPNIGVSNFNITNSGCGGTEAPRRPSTQNNNINNNVNCTSGGGSLIMAATTTTMVRKVKSKIKKKKISSNSKQNSTASLNVIYNNNSSGSTIKLQ
ncbi:nna1 carboxypeptidase isoform 3-T3 [Cochliomyia hominivorax]